MAGGAVGIGRLHVDVALGGKLLSGRHLGMTVGAAFQGARKLFLVTGGAFGVDSLFQRGHGRIALLLMTVRAVPRFRFDGRIRVMAVPTFHAVLFAVGLMAPGSRFESHMMAGCAGGGIIDRRRMVFAEGGVKSHAVAGAARFDGVAGGGVFMMTGLADDVVLRGMDTMVEDHLASGIVEQNTLGYFFRFGGQGIARNGQNSQKNGRYGDRNVAFLQGDRPLCKKVV